jgi:hypothetical protein
MQTFARDSFSSEKKFLKNAQTTDRDTKEILKEDFSKLKGECLPLEKKSDGIIAK